MGMKEILTKKFDLEGAENVGACVLCGGTGNAVGPKLTECFGKCVYVPCVRCLGGGEEPETDAERNRQLNQELLPHGSAKLDPDEDESFRRDSYFEHERRERA
jgi:hypothetical protein